MATKRPPRHVLRTVRTRCGLSQQKLARMVGCSLTTIKQIETLRLKPSADLAHRIYVQTTLDPQQLIENFEPETPRNPMGEEISKEGPDFIKRIHQDNQTQEQVDARLRHFEAVLTLLFDASTKGAKLWALQPALQAAIDKVINEFSLGGDFRRLLAQRYQVKDPWTNLSPEQSLYTIVNDDLIGAARRKVAELARKEFYEGTGRLRRSTARAA